MSRQISEKTSFIHLAFLINSLLKLVPNCVFAFWTTNQKLTFLQDSTKARQKQVSPVRSYELQQLRRIPTTKFGQFPLRSCHDPLRGRLAILDWLCKPWVSRPAPIRDCSSPRQLRYSRPYTQGYKIEDRSFPPGREVPAPRSENLGIQVCCLPQAEVLKRIALIFRLLDKQQGRSQRNVYKIMDTPWIIQWA